MRLTNTFTGGKMNKGLDERIIPKGEYRDALNIEVNNSNGAGIGAVENIKGNTNISNYSFTGDTGMVTIGSIANEATNDIYWMVSGTNFDYVLRYNSDTGATTTSLKDTKGRVLKFDSSFLITGINIINNLLFWTDDKNPPRRLNTNKSYATDGFTEDDISVIVRPPLNAPEIQLRSVTAAGQSSDNIEFKFLQFSYRYKYENNEYSAMAPFSPIAFMPGNFSYDYGDAEFDSMTNSFDTVRISLGTGSSLVKEIQVLFRDTLDSTVFVVDRFNKDKEGWPSGLEPSNANAPFIDFSSDKIYSALPVDELTRLFDNVPLKAKAQDIIGSRLVYGNYVQFFDLKDSNNIDIIPEFSLDYFPVSNSTFPSRTFKSDRDYEVGIAYLDDYGRMTTVLTSPNNSINIPASEAVNSNNLQLQINSVAPSFASKYRVFVKQNKGLYYTIFPLYYYVDGVYRYFNILRSDVDKVKEGDYIILKSGSNVNTTEIGQKFKVIEVGVKEEDFLSSTTGEELGGLYFKIKVDNPELFSPDNIFEDSYSTCGIENSSLAPACAVSNPATFMNDINDSDSLDGIINIPIYYGTRSTHNVLNVLPLAGFPQTEFEPPSSFSKDVRLKILITDSNKFKVLFLTPSGYQEHTYINGEITIDPSTLSYPINDPNLSSSGFPIFNIKFQHSSGYKINDYFIINIHGNSTQCSTILGSPEIRKNTGSGFAIVCDRDFSPSYGTGVQTSTPQDGYTTKDRVIKAGARISIEITSQQWGSNGAANSGEVVQRFISPREYPNIEEWFWESGTYRDFIQKDNSGNNIGARNVFFRRGFDRATDSPLGSRAGGGSGSNYIRQVNVTASGVSSSTNWAEKGRTEPVWMIIIGTGVFKITATDDNDTGFFIADWYMDTILDLVSSLTNGAVEPGSVVFYPAYIKTSFSIIQSEDLITFETEGKENVDDIFHETNLTLGINPDGTHLGNAGNQTLGGDPARVNLLNSSSVIKSRTNSNFNAYTFGNGVESMVIREDWNGRHLKLSPRVSSTFEDYQQERAEEALTYSGIYRAFGENSAKNNLNEFNLSLANFKYLDKAFGSIQKLNARDTDLVVFQEDKVSKVLFGKNLLSDAVGGGSVASIPEVLGTQISYAGEYGISKNPESFAQWGNDMYFTDEYRGAVCRLGLQGGIFEISSFGMSSWFRDLFIDLPGKQKIGGIDPFKDKYVLTARDVNLSTTIGFEIIDKDPQGG